MTRPDESAQTPLFVTNLSDAKAALLERWRQGGAIPTANPVIATRSPNQRIPLSLAQERIWFLEQLHPHTPIHNLFVCAEVHGRLDGGLLGQSLDELVSRHEALRTTVGVVGGVPHQVVDKCERPALRMVSLDDLKPDQALAEALRQVDTAIHEPFDLAIGPLARLLICRLPTHDLLAVVVHHFVGDGWSLGVALRELSEIYLARAAGRTPALPKLLIQYGDFATWQRLPALESDWKRDLAYWRNQLRDTPPLELPTDRPRPSVLSTDGDWREVRLSRELSDGLRGLARAEGVTPFVVTLSLLNVLMSKLSGQQDFAIGTPVANRSAPETFDLIGNFINTVALRNDLSSASSFRDILHLVHDTCAAGFAHQEIPFERVVADLQPVRDLSRNVLFQVLLVQQPARLPEQFAGLPMQIMAVGSRTSRTDLEVHVWDDLEIGGRMAFSTDLFEAGTVDRLIERFKVLLRSQIADPSRPLDRLKVVLPHERRILSAWGSGTKRRIPTVVAHDLIRRQALRSPSGVALTFCDRKLSYSELDTQANRLAHYLRCLGVGPEVRVGICLDRSLEMVIAVLGVLKAGGAYLPLDPNHPTERLSYMLKDAHAAIVLTQHRLADRLTSVSPALVCVDADEDAITAQPDSDPAVQLYPDNLAYVIYTSGSTGAPKGVQISHRALTNLILAMRQRFRLKPESVVAAVTSLAFDPSVVELLWPLAYGGTVLIASTEDVIDDRRLRKLLSQSGVTVVQATPAVWRMLAGSGGLGPEVMALCGAEAVANDLAQLLATNHRSAWNVYGPTEATVWATAGRMSPGSRTSLGRPLLNMRVHVVDSDFDDVPLGVAGEICIGGDGVSRGYLDRPALTATRFIPDPFGSEPGARMYLTGDRARFLSDGTLEFLGRIDDQVKLRGHRIELGEVEATLTSHPAVKQAVVALIGRESLVAYVVPSQQMSVASEDMGPTGQLREYLREQLPAYMVPSSFVFLNELPRTANGKVARSRLPPPERTRRMLGSTYVAPRTPLEAEIATLMRESLGIDRVGMHDDFFELGGHSLLAARLIGGLLERYQIDFGLLELFITPTAAHLAARIEEELIRQQRFGTEESRLRQIVDRLQESTVDSLLDELVESDRVGR